MARTFCAPSWTYELADGTTQTTTARLVLPGTDAACIGDRLVAELGEQRARNLRGLGTGPWSLVGFALANNRSQLAGEQIVAADAGAIEKIFEECTGSWKLMLILSVTEGADEMSDESARCVSGRLSDQDARTILSGELDRAYDDPTRTDAVPFPDLIAPLINAYDACLSPAERQNLDFN